MKLHVILLHHPLAARCAVLVLGPPGSSDALIFRGVGEWGSGNSSTDPSSVLAGKDPPWPGIVLFLMTLCCQRKIFNDIFFLFVLSSLTEGSLSLAGGLCEQDAAEQTSLILPNIEGSLINPGNPRRAARGLLETRCSPPLGTAAGPASPATECSPPAPVSSLPGLRCVPGWALPTLTTRLCPPVLYVQPCKIPGRPGGARAALAWRWLHPLCSETCKTL